jgi:hypothetical protein
MIMTMTMAATTQTRTRAGDLTSTLQEMTALVDDYLEAREFLDPAYGGKEWTAFCAQRELDRARTSRDARMILARW